MLEWLAELVDKSLHFELLCGEVSSVGKNTTGWRVLPGMVIAQLQPGYGRLTFEDGSIHPIKEGDAMVVPGGIRHKIDQNHPRAVSHWMHVNFFVLGRLDLFQLLNIPPVCHQPQSQALRAIIGTWAAQHEDWQTQSPLYAKVKQSEVGLQLLGCLLEKSTPLKKRGFRLDRIQAVSPAIEYMNQHFMEPIYREDLLQSVNMSRSKFHRLFLETTGKTPMDYLAQIRMRHAQERLLASNATIAEVGREVGYNDPFVFSKQFKQFCGVSPRTYRQTTQSSDLQL